MTKLAILGPGLLGGSLALAVREFGDVHVALWARRPEAVEEARRLGIADLASTDLAAVVDGALLVILCVPIGVMPTLAKTVLPLLSPSATVTDVGSVKAGVVHELTRIFHGRAHFIGSHPMAGSDQTGIQAARKDLFEGATCIVTPNAESDPNALEVVRHFWAGLGCRVSLLDPEAHDEVVARISHFPHVLAAALVNSVAAENAKALEYCGPGFRDTTRVASGPPGMWAEILETNRHAVRKSAEAMIEKLREFITLLDSDGLDREKRMKEFLTQAKAQRDCLRLPR